MKDLNLLTEVEMDRVIDIVERSISLSLRRIEIGRSSIQSRGHKIHEISSYKMFDSDNIRVAIEHA